MKYAILILMILVGTQVHAKKSGGSSSSSSSGGSKSGGSSSSSSSSDRSTWRSNPANAELGADGWAVGTCSGSIVCMGSGDSTPSTCPETRTVTDTCSKSVTEIPFSFSCSSHIESQSELPLKNNSNCSYADTTQMVTSVTCRVNRTVACDPCAGVPCPN